MDVAQLKRVKELKAEHAKAPADVYRPRHGEPYAKGVHRRIALAPVERREAADWLVDEQDMAASRPCRATKIDRSWRHRSSVAKVARDAA